MRERAAVRAKAVDSNCSSTFREGEASLHCFLHRAEQSYFYVRSNGDATAAAAGVFFRRLPSLSAEETED